MGSPLALRNISLVGGGPGSTGDGVIVGDLGESTDGDGNTVACVGDSITPHGPDAHIAATVVQGSLDTFVNGIPVSYVGCLCSCECTILTGSPDSFII